MLRSRHCRKGKCEPFSHPPACMSKYRVPQATLQSCVDRHISSTYWKSSGPTNADMTNLSYITCIWDALICNCTRGNASRTFALTNCDWPTLHDNGARLSVSGISMFSTVEKWGGWSRYKLQTTICQYPIFFSAEEDWKLRRHASGKD